MFHANAHSEQLQGEYEQLSSRVLKAEAAIVRARAELERVRQVLARYCGRQTEIKNILRGLELTEGRLWTTLLGFLLHEMPTGQSCQLPLYLKRTWRLWPEKKHKSE